MVVVNPKVDPRDCIIDIRIVEHDIWALATKLQCNLLQVRAGSRFHDLSTNDSRSGESDLVNVHVGGESSTCNLAEAGDDVDDTGRETSLFDKFGGVESAERCLFGRLENDDVAAGDGWADFPGPHKKGEVPWDDLRTDTELDPLPSVSDSSTERMGWTNRFLPGVVESLRVHLNDLAVDLVCPAAIIPEAAGTQTDIDLGHTERFAII